MAKVKERKRWSIVCLCGHENHIIKTFCQKCGRRIRGIITPFSAERKMPTSL